MALGLALVTCLNGESVTKKQVGCLEGKDLCNPQEVGVGGRGPRKAAKGVLLQSQIKAGGLNLGKEKEENRSAGSPPGYRHAEVLF